MSNNGGKQESSSTLPGPVVSKNEGLSWREYLMANVDPKQATTPLAMYCFMTGFMYVLTLESSSRNEIK